MIRIQIDPSPDYLRRGGEMRAFDCSHASHEDVHFTADDDEGLIQQIQQHRDEYHQEISDQQIREMVTTGAYNEGDSSATTQQTG
jgi:hypothetical protein